MQWNASRLILKVKNKKRNASEKHVRKQSVCAFILLSSLIETAAASVRFFLQKVWLLMTVCAHVFVYKDFHSRRSGYFCADWLWRIIMGLRVSQLPRWNDNHCSCPLISTGKGLSIKPEKLCHERQRHHVHEHVHSLRCCTYCELVWMLGENRRLR